MAVGALTVTKSTREAGVESPRLRAPLLASLGLAYGPLRQHPGEVLLVLGACAKVARRVQPVGRVLGRLLRFRSLLQRLLDGLGADRRRSHVCEADAPVAV